MFCGNQSLRTHLKTDSFAVTQYINIKPTQSARYCTDILDQAVEHAAAVRFNHLRANAVSQTDHTNTQT